MNSPSPNSDWTFNGAATRQLTHCYHDYPARMIPQVAGKLLDLFAGDRGLLFDPYCGTGTSLVEGLVRGLDGIGADLNPLARLIAQAKTSTPDERTVDETIAQFRLFAARGRSETCSSYPIRGIARLEFWFKPTVIERLSRIRAFIEKIDDAAVRLFFQVAFSETVRESSNTRNGEFKLYRCRAEELAKFNPDVFGIMAAKLERNRQGLQKFAAALRQRERRPSARVCDFDTVRGVPPHEIAPASVDIVITSPPYGDSRTTVAYGQYSRLSAAWLGLSEPEKIDRRLMGGKKTEQVEEFPSEALNRALRRIRQADEDRAREVSAFYSDLLASLSHVAEAIRPGGHACYVVGNRKVKGVVLPTQAAVRDFFEFCGFEHAATFQRAIPNKRMPLRNSPTNVAGIADHTMTREHIVVMRRPQPRRRG